MRHPLFQQGFQSVISICFYLAYVGLTRVNFASDHPLTYISEALETITTSAWHGVDIIPRDFEFHFVYIYLYLLEIISRQLCFWMNKHYKKFELACIFLRS